MATAFTMPEPTTQNERLKAYVLCSGDTLVVLKVHPDPQYSIQQKVNEIASRVLELDAAVRAKKLDTGLNNVGRAKALKPMQEEVLKDIEATTPFLDRVAKSIDAIEAELFAGVEPKPNDAVSALREWEIRERLPRMDPKDRGAVIDNLQRGENGEVLNALLRDPLPSQGRADAIRIHRMRVEAESPDLFQAWQEQREAIKLAREVIANYRIQTERLVNLGVGPAGLEDSPGVVAMKRAALQAPATA
jgi:hypothetical protein